MYSSYLFCQQLRWVVGVHVDQKSSSMNSVFGLVNRVHWTRFVSLETEFVGLGFKAYKLSPKNSIYMPRNQVHWTRFASPETLWTRFHLSPPITHQPLKKFLNEKHRVSKYTVSLSFPLTLSLSLTLWLSSQSQSLSLTLTLLLRHCRRRRRSVSASLSLSPSTKLLSSLLKLRKTSYFHWWVSDEEEALAVGVTSQSC